MKLKSLILCRVSSAKQVKEWNWLPSQEKRCRDYSADILWIEVEKVFYEEWISGWAWIFERKGIQEILRYIDEHTENHYVVIFEDLNRLSRDIQVHNLIRNEFRRRWIELQCPNFKFEETPAWELNEHISVAVSQYQRKENKQRVNNRMRARLEQWFWCFKVPVWLKYEEAENWWKIVVHDETICKKIKQALEKFANNEICTLEKLLIYLNKKWVKISWLWRKWNVLSTATIHRIATSPLYAWYLEVKEWGIPLMKAKHKWIISFQTFERIQKKLISNSQVERKIERNCDRLDISNHFPLRWFLYCKKSKAMLSWGWSKWRSKKFPYYTFPRKSPMRWKSISRDKIHGEFENLLHNIHPKEDLIQLFEKAVESCIQEKYADDLEYKKSLEKDLSDVERKIANFIKRLWETENEILIENYEKQIAELGTQKQEISKKMTQDLKIVWTPLKKKLELVRNALNIRKNNNLEVKKLLIKNVFPQWIPVNEKRSVWTPSLSHIYQSFSEWEKGFWKMVELMGFEPMS